MSAERVRAARHALHKAIADYEGALAADARERLEENDARWRVGERAAASMLAERGYVPPPVPPALTEAQLR